MKLTANSGGGGGEARELPEADVCPAVFVAVIDCGTHLKDYGGGEGAKDAHEVYLAWELPGQEIAGTKGGRNHVLARTFTLSLHERAGLRKVIDAVTPKPLSDGDTFDLADLLSAGCQLDVKHKVSKGKGLPFAVVKDVFRLGKGTRVAPPTYAPVYYEVDRGEEPPADEWLPYIYDGDAGKMVHVKDYVKTSHEWKGQPVEANGAGESVPF